MSEVVAMGNQGFLACVGNALTCPLLPVEVHLAVLQAQATVLASALIAGTVAEALVRHFENRAETLEKRLASTRLRVVARGLPRLVWISSLGAVSSWAASVFRVGAVEIVSSACLLFCILSFARLLFCVTSGIRARFDE